MLQIDTSNEAAVPLVEPSGKAILLATCLLFSDLLAMCFGLQDKRQIVAAGFLVHQAYRIMRVEIELMQQGAIHQHRAGLLLLHAMKHRIQGVAIG